MDDAVSTTPTALQLLKDTIAEINRAPVSDVEAVLLAGWNGFTMLATLVEQLVAHWPEPEEIPEWYVFARNHNQAAAAVAVRYLEKAPGLPPTDRTARPVAGWAAREDVTDCVPVPYDVRLWPAELADPVVAVFGSRLALARIPRLGLALNVGLHASIPHAADPIDRKALAVGVAMSAAICDCWEGRLATYFSTPKDFERAAAGAGERQRTGRQLTHDTALVGILREALAGCADGDGWASIAAAGSRIRALAPDFQPQAYGYPNLTQLILATGLFQTRKTEHGKGQLTIYIRDKRRRR
ncbi:MULTISPECIES: OST-HTH/LOTUS domain-containing protein [unclassified Nocardia]|uniref:OST-HTH/LOTUS domain-containing protein n=1 Tax=unclassified Nocardia TaxID=2637762 RepID=UPI001CE4928D|nr:MULTISPECIES: OST-HTH/LOTUS domain-containing protein [unclassified Nocardia]